MIFYVILLQKCMHPQICTDYVLRPLSAEEEQTCESLVRDVKGAKITPLPTHHISSYGHLTGFHYRCPSKSPATALPVSRKMFFGHTLVECQVSETDILKLILQKSKNSVKMAQFLQRVQSQCVPALLEHGPENTGYMDVYNHRDVLTKDCGHWTPNVPDCIGLYHAMIRGYNREVREHKLFAICSGGLDKASDEFCNFIIDLGDKCDAYTVANSSEVWWLRRASRRARCDLLYQLTQEFGINIQQMEDIQSKNDRMIAVHLLDTLECDMEYRSLTDEVHIFDGCTNTSRPSYGALVKMHPAEGYWLFRSGETNCQLNRVGMFPVSQPVLDEKRFCIPVRHGSQKIVAMDKEYHADKKKTSHYMCFDEAYFAMLQKMQWDRNQGYVELIPVITGINGL